MVIIEDILSSNIKSDKHIMAYTTCDFSPLNVNNPISKHKGLLLKDILSLEFFNNKRDIFNNVYKELLTEIQDTKPNDLYYRLSELNIPIITETIDGLHRKAGNENTIELYGSLTNLQCTTCCTYHSAFQQAFTTGTLLCPLCHQQLRPAVVLFGESVNNLCIALNEIYKADYLFVFGNSFNIWPANQIFMKAIASKCKIVYCHPTNSSELP